MRCARSEKVAKLWVESYRHGEAYLQVADGGAGAGAGHNAVFPGADLRGGEALAREEAGADKCREELLLGPAPSGVEPADRLRSARQHRIRADMQM